MSSYKTIQTRQQVQYCSTLMNKIDSRILQRDLKRDEKGYLPIFMPQQLTKTAIKREITELRAALLELSKMLEV